MVRRDGLEHASVRNVAREAGLSMGSLRHYFASQSELMTFALRMVIDGIEQRIAAVPSDGDPRQRAERVLAELLPLDDQRRAENEVWLAFTARAMTDPELRALRDEGYDMLRAGCRGLVAGLFGPGRDPEREAARLHALLDGLAVHAAMRPDVNTPDALRAVIADHLAELQAPRTTDAPTPC
ncbi:TetR/AcrR family transcriptional regulator [Streptomyces yanii]